VKTSVSYFDPRVARGDTSGVRVGDSTLANCGDAGGNATCPGPDAGRITVNQPMEAKLGVRFHAPSGKGRAGRHRDPMADDLFDAEIDLTWANNSALDSIQVRFPANADGSGVIPAVGTGGTVPPLADVPRGYRDVFGARIGGDYNVLPGALALRAGAFFETNGQDPAFQNIDFIGSSRFGMSGGISYRVHFGATPNTEQTSDLTLMAGFGHIFAADQTRTDSNASGLSALAGSPCFPSSNDPGPTCPNGNQKFRTNWPVNLGTITNSVNAINIGASYRF
jgi:long-subunit fatty acid transport protein